MTITTRATKGSSLTHSEMDVNFTDLRDGIGAKVPKTKGTGIKIGPNGGDAFGWHDLVGEIFARNTGPTAPAWNTYRAGINQYQFSVNDEAWINFHIPHDYAPGTDMFIHSHWSHNSTTVTGGSVTWGFEISYAKGHNQAAFAVPVVSTILQSASTTQYQHMIAETQLSSPIPTSEQINSNIIEVDGIIMCRVYLNTNGMTVSGGGVPEPFLHFIDIHYQSTNVATKNKSPDFWS